MKSEWGERVSKKWKWVGSKDQCWRCGGKIGREIEEGSTIYHHLIPESEGGSDTDDNLSLLCGNCHNVIHKRKMGVLGSRRTRNGQWRKLTDIGSYMRISHKEPNREHPLCNCPECGHKSKVVGVLEGWFGGMGMVVILDCLNCGHKFGVPFIGRG